MIARWTGRSLEDVQRVGQLNFDLSEKLGVLTVDPNTKNDDRFRNRLKKQRILNLVQIRVPICTLMVKGGGPLTMRGIC